eukprot:1265529-Rhodomonas_salina.3
MFRTSNAARRQKELRGLPGPATVAAARKSSKTKPTNLAPVPPTSPPARTQRRRSVVSSDLRLLVAHHTHC